MPFAPACGSACFFLEKIILSHHINRTNNFNYFIFRNYQEELVRTVSQVGLFIFKGLHYSSIKKSVQQSRTISIFHDAIKLQYHIPNLI